MKQLEYEAYEPMALKEIHKICSQIREKWKVENIAIVHRTGYALNIVLESVNIRESIF